MKRPSSKKKRKQHKWIACAPLHSRQGMMHSMLSDELKKKYGRNCIQVRKGDMIKVLRGSFRGVSGQVTGVNLKSLRVYVQGVTIKKADGTEVERPVHPSNLMITELFEEDKRRREVLTRNSKEAE
ncbi:MAG: 50S ribosomal protein L24 [Candidatus Altiarchaeota archaeon]|nr:50S ribosomal protein L24 [Candidatus Altiarchaeota archaeon]